MKWGNLLSFLSWFGTIEVAVSAFPCVILVLLCSWWNPEVSLLRWMGDIGVVYICFSWILSRVGKWQSEKRGLRYYYVIPISNRLLRVMLRNRMQVDQDSPCYLVHVNTSRRRNSVKAAICDMRSDMERLQQSWQWGRNPIFVGSTFTELGRRQEAILHRYADVQMKPGTLMPLQSLMLTKSMMRQQQRTVFGRVLIKDARASWKVVIIRPFERKEHHSA